MNTKTKAILEAIRNTDVGDLIILHNTDNSIWCILKVICKEHPETKGRKWQHIKK